MEQMKAGDIFFCEHGEILIRKFLGRGKSGYSYLGYVDGKLVVLKLMHQEPCSYYHFSESKVNLELKAYDCLKKHITNIPRLYFYNVEKGYLAKEYIDGCVATEYIIQGQIAKSLLQDLFRMSEALRGSGINLDWFPNNFVVRDQKIYYIDYEINPYAAEWSLEHWGLFFWANSNGMKEYVETGNHRAICLNDDSGKPIEEPFRHIVKEWHQEFGVVA